MTTPTFLGVCATASDVSYWEPLTAQTLHQAKTQMTKMWHDYYRDATMRIGQVDHHGNVYTIASKTVRPTARWISA